MGVKVARSVTVGTRVEVIIGVEGICITGIISCFNRVNTVGVGGTFVGVDTFPQNVPNGVVKHFSGLAHWSFVSEH